MQQRLLLSFLFILPLISFSQTDSVTHIERIPTIINSFYEGDYIYGVNESRPLDTSIVSANKVNIPLEHHHNFLGTNGSASHSQVFSDDFQLTTRTGMRGYNLYMLNPEDLAAFRSNKRFSEVVYSTGAFKENAISLFHSQNITKYWNAGFLFDRMSVQDFMNYSDTYRSRFGFFTWYRSPNGRYSVFVDIIWNSVKNEVNGGLTNDSLFENTAVTNLGIKGLAYEISNAEERTRQRTLYASQYFDLGKAIYDTSGNVIGRNTIVRLNYKATLERKTFAYLDSDPDSSFYQNYYYGEATYDSLHSDEFRNRFAIQKPAGAFGKSAFMRNWSQGVFVELQNIKYGQRKDTSWHNLTGGANVLWQKDSSSFSLFGEVKYVFDGLDAENYSFRARVASPQFAFGQVAIELHAGTCAPDYFFRYYDSNNFRWSNDFKPIEIYSPTVSYNLSRYRIQLSYTHYKIENLVYLTSSALPWQLSVTSDIDVIKLRKDFTYRTIHLDNTFYFQNTTNAAIPLPDFLSENTLYHEKKYFKNLLKLSTGFRFKYSSAYFAESFMPATSEFFVQSEKKTGGYLRTDLFINAGIKTAIIYIKFENLLDGLSGRSYFTTPHYPMPGRVFRFGVKWRFFD